LGVSGVGTAIKIASAGASSAYRVVTPHDVHDAVGGDVLNVAPPLLERRRLASVRIYPHHIAASLGERNCEREPDVAESDDTYLHSDPAALQVREPVADTGFSKGVQ
jgi:hypothetical protein